jgi:hypothetical protein
VPPLDRWLPEFDVHERHERLLPVSPERALQIVLAVPAAPDPVVRLLLRLRGLRPGRSIEELQDRLGFDELERTPRTLVAGGCGTPWRPRAGSRPFANPAPGTVRMAMAFWAEPRADGSLLLTETRVTAVDERARRAFRRYWRLVGPFSALIRRRWLAAAAKRAASG